MPECLSFSDRNSEDKETDRGTFHSYGQSRGGVEGQRCVSKDGRKCSESPGDHVLDELSQESIRKKYTSKEKKEI